MFQNILQYREVRSQNAVARWLGGRSGNIVPKPLSSKLLSIGALLAAYDLKRKGFAIGIAHVGAQGYTMPEGDQITESKCQEELCSLWLAGECYDA